MDTKKHSSAAIMIAVHGKDNKLYIGCHFDNNPKKHRFKKISACGGNVDEGENTLDAAIREAKEEHGLTITDKNKVEFITETINKLCNRSYVYYGVDVQPCDYSTDDIGTPREIFQNKDFIEKIFSKFPENSVIRTGSKFTFLIDLKVLISDEYSQYIYKQFHCFLNQLNDGVPIL